MFHFSYRNLSRFVTNIMNRFFTIDTAMDGYADTMDDIADKLDDIRSTFHDTNIISFTVTGTTSGTVTYVRQ